MSIEFDSSPVERLAIDLSGARGRIQRSAPKVMKRGAVNIKANMREDASGHGHLHHLPRTVNFDQLDAEGLSFEIGFDKVGQGKLANIAAFGSVNNAAVLDHTAGLRREIPRIVHYLGDDAEAAVLGRDTQ